MNNPFKHVLKGIQTVIEFFPPFLTFTVVLIFLFTFATKDTGFAGLFSRETLDNLTIVNSFMVLILFGFFMKDLSIDFSDDDEN